ncbi:MAG: adenosylcobinamide-phosphate synthase CbiB [Thiohalomonadaceae bacterium]
MWLALTIGCALLLDLWLGEPRHYHPLVGFGRLAAALEVRLNRRRRLLGVLALSLAVLPPVALAVALTRLPQVGVLAEVFLLYLAIGATSLAQHGRAVAAALAGGDLALARQRVGWMVSRDTAALDEAGVARAATESVLENGNDAVFGALFWFAVLGAPGAVLYRLVNTLDAMWGYRSEHYAAFGWAAARLDDVLNWIPARLTALSYALLGDGRRALRCWRRQGHRTASPNAGVVMAAGAGALGLQLGGPAIYHGSVEERPLLGEGLAPGAADILRAIRLVQYSLWLWLGVIVVLDAVLRVAH